MEKPHLYARHDRAFVTWVSDVCFLLASSMCRLEREIYVSIPAAAARHTILQALTCKLPVEQSVDLQRYMSHSASADLPVRTPNPKPKTNHETHPISCRLASICHGYTGADLTALCREAAMSALHSLETGSMHHVGKSSRPEKPFLPGGERLITVTDEDFQVALTRVRPSLARGATVEYQAMR